MSQGCAASIALNYDPTAALPCYDCCLFPREGCMEPTAQNYDPEANIPGSCYIRGCTYCCTRCRCYIRCCVYCVGLSLVRMLRDPVSTA